METCDVLIVGGGPAGSACAWALRRAGIDVLVMDRATFPRDKVCAGWITPAVLSELHIDVDKYGHNRILQPMTGFRTGTIGGETIQTDYGSVVSYGICRREFDHFLLQRSQARLRQDEPFRSVWRDAGGWVVNESLRSRWLIGAGGHFCPVARQFLDRRSSLEDSSHVVFAQEIELAMSSEQQSQCAVEGTHPELYFCSDLAGYGWVFRKQSVVNIGLGRLHESRLGEQVARFRDFLRAARRIDFELPDHFHGHAYRLRSRFVQPREPNLLLIGDAAGLASVHSGEGIRPAIESGLLAAQLIAEDRATGATAAEDYVSRLTAHFGAPSSEACAWLPAAIRTKLGGLLLKSRWFTRHVVLDRWFLNRHQPAMSL